MIIGLSGPKLAGKGTVADFLVKEFGAQASSMSGILTDIAHRLYLPNSRENLIGIATGLRSQFGEDILAKVLGEDLKQTPDTLAIIDGIRMPSEVAAFSQLPGFKLLFIDAPVEVRYQRALQRGEKVGESEMSFEQFLAEEKAVTETGIESLRQAATAQLQNTGSLDELYDQVRGLVRQFEAETAA